MTFLKLLALYRDVPLPHEVKGSGNFMPNIAPNADELIDYALSFIPPSKTTHSLSFLSSCCL
jgi:hypothetical protein